MDNPNTYRGFLIVGAYPQYDMWSIKPDGEEGDLVDEWDRSVEPDFIQIWSWDEVNEVWSSDNEFELQEFKTLEEAKQAIDRRGDES